MRTDSAKRSIKLYRGLKSNEFSYFTPEVSDKLRQTWARILKSRSKGNFTYPQELNSEILNASKLVRLQRQHFTDNKKIAYNYARQNGGLLVEVEVPISDLLNKFTVEFQNFSNRKKQFEIVYVVDSSVLFKSAIKWKLKSKRLVN